MARLFIADQEHYDETKKKALEAGLEEYWNAWHDRVESWGDDDHQFLLYKDWAPMSFSFAIYRGEAIPENRIIVGGLIYQGPECPADGGAPSFTVSLDSKRVGWFMHT
jgi:hypothetical protein